MSTLVTPVLDNGDPQTTFTPSLDAAVAPDNHDRVEYPSPSLASARQATEEA